MDVHLPLSIIEHNLTIFNQLGDYQKLIIHKNYTVELDNRYFQSLRRTLDWWIWSYDSSKQSTYQVIHLTFESLKSYQSYYPIHLQYILDTLTHLKNNVQSTYPNYQELKDLLDQLFSFYHCQTTLSEPMQTLSPYYQILYDFANVLKKKKKIKYDVYY